MAANVGWLNYEQQRSTGPRIRHNFEKIQTLTTLRDTLLPRLISGQLRLNQAQDLVYEVEA